MNPHLVNDLIELGLWTSDVKNALLALNGSVQQIKAIPPHIKELYKTVWEIPQKCLINLAVARGAYICQSQNLNIYMPDANFAKMTSMHFHGWKKGLKTGLYYLRTRPSRDAIKFTVNIEQLLQAADAGNNEEIIKCLSLQTSNIKELAADVPEVEKLVGGRESRLVSTSSMQDDDHGNSKQKSAALPIPEDQEVEEVTFECINCSG